jgi:hypothetical protein
MSSSRWLALLAGMALAATAHAGAPQPDTRQGEFAHVCRSGANKNRACTIATEAQDCPRSTCVLRTLSNPVKATLTIIAHDAVTDWANGGATNQALTVLLEVRAPNGTQQMLAATYQNLAEPRTAPTAPTNVVAIDMDEFALRAAAGAVDGLLFVQPEATLAEQLQTLFGQTGTPVLVATERQVQSADHTGDGLATVVRFKMKLQFVDPA